MALLMFAVLICLNAVARADLPCPVECECYYKLFSLYADCSGKNLQQFPGNLDDQVQGLDLSNNLFTVIPSEIESFKQLEILNMSSNRISEINKNALSNLTNLVVLDLSQNQISSLQVINGDTLFVQTTSLKRLILSRNQLVLSSVPTDHLASDSVETLELENCGLVDVEGKSFLRGLTALRTLKLGHNSLKRMKLVSKTMETLDVSHCQLSRITSKTLEFLPSLTHLYISHNYRLDLSSKTGSFSSPSLIYIDMSFCNMNKISLSGLPNLYTLILRGNMIRRLTGGEFFNNSKLTNLDLSSNAISNVHPNSFFGLSSLKYLNLSVNVIPTIHEETFLRTPNLTHLSISRNYLSSLGSLKLPSLVDLDLSTCEIQHMNDKIFQNMPRLLKINLSRNLISSVPPGIKSESLQQLDLSFNRISSIDESTFEYLPSLLKIDLSRNRFTEIFTIDYFQNNTRLKEINLEDNTWRCDCSDPVMKEFFTYITHEPSKVWDISTLVCHSPPTLSGQNWLKSCYFVWFPEALETSTTRAMHFLLAILFAFFICFVVLFVIKRSLRVKLVAQQEEQRRRLEEARERLRESQMRREQEAMRNAPDPRDLVSPPSYEEALLMPRLDSFHSLSEMGMSQAKKKKRAQRRTRSSGDLLDDAEPVHDGERRRRRKSRDRNGRQSRSQSTTNVRSQNGEAETPQEEIMATVHYAQESNL